jgi:predicted SprT family Zn-dependent metalloprotease
MPYPSLRVLEQGEAFLRNLGAIWRHSRLAEVHLRLNTRLSRSAARCLPAQGVIEVSAATLGHPAAFRREVLCHEAAHAVVSARYGRKARPHGPEWQALVRQAGFEPRASLVRCGQGAQPKTGQTFLHTCPVCHFSKRAKRRMPRWRCPECRAAGLEGTLRIEHVRARR